MTTGSLQQRSNDGDRSLNNRQFAPCPEEYRAFIEKTSLEHLVYWKLESFLNSLTEQNLPTDLLKKLIIHVEKPLMALILRKTFGNKLKAAAILGCHRNTLQRKLTVPDFSNHS